MRSKFVEKVSKSMLKQLLDDLLLDRLLNDGEVESVVEDNSAKSDMARCLVDMVRKKGDKASRKLIQHIEDRDPSLYEVLELSCGPAPGETLVNAIYGYRLFAVIKNTNISLTA